MPTDWSRLEVEAIVADYLAMLLKELSGVPFSKAEHRRAVSNLLNDRSEGSIEMKHQNISAVLISHGYPYISGYKPLGNYQRLLADVVTEQVRGNSALGAAIDTAITVQAETPTIENFEQLRVTPPGATSIAPPAFDPGGYRPPINYFEREQRNASVGRAGEEFVLGYEQWRLRTANRDDLAERIEHVALGDDGAGFDIRSFDVDGSDRLIEVKTTAFGRETPFYLSRNQIAVSQQHAEHYHLYRVFHLRRDVRFYGVQGAVDRMFRLEPVEFVALHPTA